MVTIIKGSWYPKDSSNQYPAQLTIKEANYEVEILPQHQAESAEFDSTINQAFKSNQALRGQLSEIVISSRLGNTERKLSLADGSVFTTLDNDTVDSIVNSDLHSSSSSKLSLLLHRHETKMSSVLLMLLLTIGFVFSFAKWGLPWTSHAIAQALPQATGDYIGKQSLDFIDDYFLQPSQISKAEQQRIRTRFDSRIKPLVANKDISYQLHFREMSFNGQSIPNAFALPSGDIVLTDKFVQLSKNEDEIDAVLLHEVGHVVRRHSLEMLTQNSLMTVIVTLVLGNPDAISELATGLGTALVSNHYSRQYETEADEFAFNKMLTGNIDPQAFADILNRMEGYSLAKFGSESNPETSIDNDTDETDEESLSDFLSTHPNTKLRVKMAEKYKACFDKGLTVCE